MEKEPPRFKKRAIKQGAKRSPNIPDDSVTRYLGCCPSKPEGLLMETRHTTHPSHSQQNIAGKEFLVLLEKICT